MSVIICVQKRLPPGKWMRRPGRRFVNAKSGEVLQEATVEIDRLTAARARYATEERARRSVK